MTKYRVALITTVTTWVDVEADDRFQAVEKALEKGAPGLMHLDHTYPNVDTWVSTIEGFTVDPWDVSEAVIEY